MGVVKISVGGTWKDAQSTTTTTQTCEACKYNCTDRCAGNCIGGCDKGCYGRCYGSCNSYCTSCDGCAGACRSCYGCSNNCTGGNRANYTPRKGNSNPGTWDQLNSAGYFGTQYGTEPGTQATTTTDNTGRVNVGGGGSDRFLPPK